MSTIERVGVSLDKELLAEFDELIEKQGTRTVPRPYGT
jgi:metal-responsive CopG/Arc/MetJ family transcriptional regulator